MARRQRITSTRSARRPRLLEVEGFKSVRDSTSIELAPLTLLCGANSSGKSAFMQPLLLVKQTLEVGYDPGPLLLDGPNVRFGRVSEMLWRGKAKRDVAKHFSVGFHDNDGEQTKLTFTSGARGLSLSQLEYRPSERLRPSAPTLRLRAGMSHDDLYNLVDPELRDLLDRLGGIKLEVQRQRCFFEIRLLAERSQAEAGTTFLSIPSPMGATSSLLQHFATTLLHLPGLRDLPERLYPATQASDIFPGPFHTYVASVIAGWTDHDDIRWHGLNDDLHSLGLTWKVDAKRIDDTKVALRVGRLPSAQQGGALDLVNIADVGLGVSQTLPILVALRIAREDQIVYLEQPEIHLHPRAQAAIAPILLAAARRGVIVVCETHSHLLLRAIQNEVARTNSLASLVKLHWFSRDKDGVTRVSSTGLDERGAYGELPLDFGEVELELENRYLDAVQANW